MTFPGEAEQMSIHSRLDTNKRQTNKQTQLYQQTDEPISLLDCLQKYGQLKDSCFTKNLIHHGPSQKWHLWSALQDM